ncbi:MAG: 2Fe-2S iron-sulfur cluster-binding protein [Polaromonas sp.]|nr:2Fe-2S iron-sulfur cluster-binding protein [Polaromonas sp.]
MSKITINFIAADGRQTGAQGQIGKSLMEAAVAAAVDGIAADCGGTLTCATCHVFVQQPFADRLPAPDGEELAMLAFTATPASKASRLSCQIKLTPELDGLAVELPATQY